MFKILYHVMYIGLFLCPAISVAQINQDFDFFYQEGERYEDAGKYQLAIYNFEAAKEVAESIADEVLLNKARIAVERATRKKDEALEAAAEQERIAKETALKANRDLASTYILLEETNKELEQRNSILEKALEESKANEISIWATKELEAGNTANSLDLAFWAYQKTESQLNPGIKRSFGNAVMANRSFELGKSPGPSIRTAISPDGRYALTILPDHGVKLWQIGREDPLAQLQGHTGAVYAMTFSPDNQYIVTASADKTARIWTQTGQEIARLNGHAAGVTGAVYSPTGKQILTWSRDGTAMLWDTAGNRQAILAGHKGPVLSAGFSPPGNAIYTRGVDGTVRIWDASGQPISPQGIPHSGYIYVVKFSPDGQRILTGTQQNTSGLWDLTGNRIAGFPESGGAISTVDFSPDGKKILTAGADGWLRIWDVDGDLIAEELVDAEGITGAGFGPYGEKIYTFSPNTTIRLWNSSAMIIAEFYRGHQDDDITSVAFLPGGHYLLSTSHDGTVRIWDVEGDIIFSHKFSEAQLIRAVHSTENGHILIAAQQDPPLFFPNPDVVLASLKNDPPPLTEDIKERTGLTEKDIKPGVLAGSWHPVRLASLSESYRLQLGVFRDTSGFKYTAARTLGMVATHPRDDLFVISVMGFSTRAEVEEVRERARRIGFDKSFIVVEEVEPSSLKDDVPVSTNNGLTPVDPKLPEVSDAKISPPESTTSTQHFPFKIQLAAYKNESSFDPSRVNELGLIESMTLDNGYIRKLIGGIATLEEARRLLPLAQKAGFPKAFIWKEENGKLIRVP
ncbi:MAG: hypothetical protein R2824_26470 [Saprospiraceae bacterium]|nr:WD40 repeat domain-containing protein [Lewinella sp.]